MPRFFGPGKPTEDTLKRVGKNALDKFIAATPGLAQLRAAIRQRAKCGWMPGLDGRRVPIPSDHKTLNFMVTSAEAVICKRWLINVHDELRERFGDAADIVAWVHDEIVVCCKPGIAEPRLARSWSAGPGKRASSTSCACRWTPRSRSGAAGLVMRRQSQRQIPNRPMHRSSKLPKSPPTAVEEIAPPDPQCSDEPGRSELPRAADPAGVGTRGGAGRHRGIRGTAGMVSSPSRCADCSACREWCHQARERGAWCESKWGHCSALIQL